MKTSKALLRSELKKHRQAFVKKENSPQILFDQRISCLDPAILSSAIIGGYSAFGGEVSPAAILARAQMLGKQIALPYLAGRDADMRFKSWATGQELETARFGFAQPLAAAANVVPDLILVPLVGFDRHMNRLGQGAGHYDRYFFCNNSSLKIGLAWSCQEIDLIPADDWDVKLDAILTEKAWIGAAKSAIGK